MESIVRRDLTFVVIGTLIAGGVARLVWGIPESGRPKRPEVARMAKADPNFRMASDRGPQFDLRSKFLEVPNDRR